MALIRWEDKYLIGDKAIDDEHRALFAMINDFYDSYMEDHDRARVIVLFNRLVDYAQRHFANEEAVMQRSGFPDFDAHRARHEALFEQVFELNSRLQDRSVNPTHATVQFLKGWLSDHIMLQDRVLGAHLGALKGK